MWQKSTWGKTRPSLGCKWNIWGRKRDEICFDDWVFLRENRGGWDFVSLPWSHHKFEKCWLFMENRFHQKPTSWLRCVYELCLVTSTDAPHKLGQIWSARSWTIVYFRVSKFAWVKFVRLGLFNSTAGDQQGILSKENFQQLLGQNDFTSFSSSILKLHWTCFHQSWTVNWSLHYFHMKSGSK